MWKDKYRDRLSHAEAMFQYIIDLATNIIQRKEFLITSIINESIMSKDGKLLMDRINLMVLVLKEN